LSLFLTAIAAFFLCVTIGLFRFAHQERNRPTFRCIALSGVVSLIACIAYFVMSRNLFTQGISGETFLIPRYIEWLLTTPIIVINLSLQARSSRAITSYLVVFDIVMVLTGFLAALVPIGTIRTMLLLLSVAGFALLVGVLVRELAQAERTAPPLSRPTFRELIFLTVFVWFGYPVVWFLSSHVAGVIPDSAQNFLYAGLDIVAKGLLALLVVRQAVIIDREFMRIEKISAPTVG
jgi:sensory rhodopsin